MAVQPNRLARGGLIDRSATLAFRFDGRACEGHPGDTLASALLANGVTLVGRSFKYHRPRGIWGAGSEEPNALVELRSGGRREPNTRATTAELFEGLDATSQNRWPSLRFDLMAANGLAGKILGAGFYYKTFMWPPAFWEKVYEPLIRRAAGLGRAAAEPDPDHYDREHLFCDVLVIGGGPAGLAAALAAGRTGASVILADEDAVLGGRLLAERLEIDGAPASRWLESALGELGGLPNVTVLARTTVFGVYDGGVYGAVRRMGDHLAVPDGHGVRQRYCKIVARRAVLAAGAVERPIAFPGNDRPGVMSAAAVRAYVNRYGVRPGRTAVVFTAGDDGWRTAFDLRAAGVVVEAVVDARAAVPEQLRAQASRVGMRVFPNSAVIRTGGVIGLQTVTVRDPAGGRHTIQAELLAVSGGWNPTLHLTCHLGGKPRWDDQLAAFVPGALPPGLRAAGAAAGVWTLAAALREGTLAGAEAAGDAGHAAGAAEPPRAEDEPAALAAFFHVDAKGKAFVDFQNDVTADDVRLAAREGYRSVEHAKRYTTLGMATDQGKTANVVGLAVLAEATGRTIAETGTTVFRPPYTPVPVGTLVGHHTGKDYRPARFTPLHNWAASAGASFFEAGAWYRAQWYKRQGEQGWRDSVDREALHVRTAVGVCDVSTLGKIEVVGPDAGTLLDLVYTNLISTMPVGRCRYGLMLRDDGFVMDDGTCARFAEDRFFVTTTTVNAAKVLQHLEWCHQVLRPELDVSCFSVTDRWAQVSIAGPRARDLVGALLDDPFDLSTAAFPHMSAGRATIGGREARVYRLSFSGELAYEVGVPADDGEALIRRVLEAGKPFDVAPYGTEALGVLRIEKGHVAGNELNGQTTARDLGLEGLLSKKKDFIGRRMLGRPALVAPERPVLVGLKPVDPSQPLRSGAHFIDVGAAATLANDRGFVTSAAWSPTLRHAVALGLLANGKARLGERIRAVDPLRGTDVEAELCSPVFIDPEGERTRV